MAAILGFSTQQMGGRGLEEPEVSDVEVDDMLNLPADPTLWEPAFVKASAETDASHAPQTEQDGAVIQVVPTVTFTDSEVQDAKADRGYRRFVKRCRSRSAITLGLWLTFALAVLTSTVGVWMFAVWVGFHVNQNGQLVDASGGIVQVASAETFVATDGTLRMRSNYSHPVATKQLESWSSLLDLPMQSLEFLNHLRRISIYVDRHVELYSITGFKWFNASYMELETTRDRDLVIAGGKAFLRDLSSSEIKHVVRPANEPQCGRQLSAVASLQPRAHSWASLVRQYHDEIAESSAHRKWRRMDETEEGMTDMLEWFGALISSEIAVEQAQVQASAAARASYCKFNTSGLECKAYKASFNVKPPRLSPSGYMRFTVRDSSQASIPSSGELMHLYIDISDWARGRANPQVRQKLAARVMLSDVDFEEGGTPPWLDITEFIGSDAYRYEMPHPAAWPEMYYQNVSGTNDGGLELATSVLEKSENANLKMNCKHENFLSHDEGYAVQKKPAAQEVDFRCEDGTFTWDIGGWRVETSANGTILAFMAFNDKDGSETLHLTVEHFADGGDDEGNPMLAHAFENGLIFNGCQPDQAQSQKSQVEELGRRLGWKEKWTEVQAFLSDTIWCGSGTDNENTECPTSDNSGDLNADHACRRHDHCARSGSVLGGLAGRLACSCDYDLLSAGGHNWAVKAVYGSRGLSRLWGCYNMQNYRRWGSRRRWRWHRETVYGETTRYGRWRYNGGLHSYGYVEKFKTCDGDLF